MLDKAISIVCTVEAAQRQYEKKLLSYVLLESGKLGKSSETLQWQELEEETDKKQTNKHTY